MNRLQLVNALRRECSVAGEGVATTINQSGEPARLVAWIDQAYEDIQNEYFDWKFLKLDSSFSTQTITNIITPPTDLNIWDVERFYDDEGNNIEVIEYADLDFKPLATDTGKPSMFIIKNDNTLMAYPYPDAVYTYSYDYFRKPYAMTADTDTPAFPSQFHQVIVARAMIYYGNYEAAAEIKQQGVEVYQTMLRKLEASQTAREQQIYGRSDSVDIVITTE